VTEGTAVCSKQRSRDTAEVFNIVLLYSIILRMVIILRKVIILRMVLILIKECTGCWWGSLRERSH
jgi:hypothetical protein